MVSSEEGESFTGYMMSLRGLPVDEIFAMRRMKMSHQVTVQLDKLLLLHTDQIAEDQGDEWLNFATAQLKTERPTDLSEYPSRVVDDEDTQRVAVVSSSSSSSSSSSGSSSSSTSSSKLVVVVVAAAVVVVEYVVGT